MTVATDSTTPVVAARARRPRMSLDRLARIDLAVVGVLFIFALVQSPGETSFDTKLDLVVDPVSFLGRAFDAWDSEGGFGQVQNQAFGYLWPMGPFFALGHLAGLPPWVVQAVWMGLLLGVAYIGGRRLATALGVSAGGAVTAGVVYAVSPRMLTVLGPISAEALPVALVPWMLLPLILQGRSLRRTAFLSALAVFAMGAANAALTLAVLPIAVLWIATQCAQRWRLLAWWSSFVALFSVWWFVPLVVQGRIAPPFLDYIESAVATTGVVTPAAALRGSTHWVAYLVFNGVPWWPAGFELAVDDVAVVATTGIAACGLIGLAMRRLTGGLVWGLSLLVGFVLLTMGSGASPGSPLQSLWWELLDGPFVPFRNIHKFDPLVRLPLALGVGVVTAWALTAFSDSRPKGGGRRSSHSLTARTLWRPVAGGVAVLLLGSAAVAAAQPLLGRDLRPGPRWEGTLPSYWEDAAEFLGEDDSRALVIPSSGFGEYVWGRTVDEPLQPLAEGQWAGDGQIPLGAVGTARLLDSVNRRLESGRGSDGLAALLARSGVGHLVVRNDLDYGATGSPRPALVHAALAGSPGLTRVASFGPIIPAAPNVPPATTGYAFDPAYPSIEIFAVDRAAAAVDAVEIDSLLEVSGGSESLLHLLESDVLLPDQPAVLTVDAESPPVSAIALTDGLRLRERSLGRAQGYLSATRSLAEPSRVARRAGDLHGSPPDGHQTVLELQGVRSVNASSSPAYADSLLPIDASRSPLAALDGSQDTWWQSSSFGGPVGQWLEVTLDEPPGVGPVVVDFVESAAVGPRVSRIRVSTDNGVEDVDVRPGGRAEVDLPGGAATSLRITVLAVDGSAPGGFAGIREVTMPGVSVSRPLLLPPAPEGAEVEAIELSLDAPPRRACLLLDGATRCDPSLLRGTEEPAGLDRLVDVDAPFSGGWTARGLVRPGPDAADLFDPVGEGIRVEGSSWLGEEPLVRPAAAVDGTVESAWVAAFGDPRPTLDLEFGVVREISSVRVLNGEQPAVSRPTRVRITTDDGSVESSLDLGGNVLLPEGTTSDSLRVEVLAWASLVSRDPSNRIVTEAPVGISEVEVSGVEDLVYRPDLDARTGSVCGLGPSLLIGDTRTQTQVEGTLRQVLDGAELTIQPCDDTSAEVGLRVGRHRVTLAATSLLLPTSLTLRADDVVRPQAAERQTRVVRNTATERVVEVGRGEAAVLRMAESANTGWQATLAGTTLPSMMLDGWQQGFRIPAGEGGIVTIRFTPDRVHKAGLVSGFVLVAVGIVLGLLSGRARPPRHQLRARSVGPRAAAGLLVLSGALLAGWVGTLVAVLVVVVGGSLGTRPHRWRPIGAGILAIVGLALWWAGDSGSVTDSATWGVTVCSVAAVLWAVYASVRPANDEAVDAVAAMTTRS